MNARFADKNCAQDFETGTLRVRRLKVESPAIANKGQSPVVGQLGQWVSTFRIGTRCNPGGEAVSPSGSRRSVPNHKRNFGIALILLTGLEHVRSNTELNFLTDFQSQLHVSWS